MSGSWGHSEGIPTSDPEAPRLAAALPLDARRRRIRLGVIAALSLAVVAIGAWAYLQIRVGRRLADAIAEADRSDPNWRLADLMSHREPVPDSENGAIVVAKAAAQLPKTWPASPPLGNGQTRKPSSAESTLALLAEASDNLLLTDDSAALLREALSEVPDAVRIARTVAHYLRGRNEITPAHMALATPLPDTQRAYSVAKLLSIDAALRAQEGDTDGALESCLALLCVGRSVGDEPFLISQLVRIACGRLALNSTRRALALSEPSDSVLARLQGVLRDELEQPLMLWGTRGERAGLDDLIRKIGEGEIDPAKLDMESKGDPDQPPIWVSPWHKTLFTYQRAVSLEWMNDAVAIARRPDDERERLINLWEARVAALKNTRYGLTTATLPVLLMPAMDNFSIALGRHRGELASMIVLLGAERHRRRSGTWPSSVAEIGGDLLPVRPTDPFGGQPLRVEHRDGQFFVYSLGRNLIDDHGNCDPKGRRDGPFDAGTVAWDVSLRRQRPDLPDRVFEGDRDQVGPTP